MIFGLFAWWLYEADGAEAALLRGVVASIFVAITVYGVTFPLLPALFPSALVAEEVKASPCTEPQVASTGSFQEPSLVFLVGTGTRFTDGVGAAEFLNHGACRFALIDARSERSFMTRADAIGLALCPQRADRGLQYQHRPPGRALDVSFGAGAMTAASEPSACSRCCGAASTILKPR